MSENRMIKGEKDREISGVLEGGLERKIGPLGTARQRIYPRPLD